MLKVITGASGSNLFKSANPRVTNVRFRALRRFLQRHGPTGIIQLAFRAGGAGKIPNSDWSSELATSASRGHKYRVRKCAPRLKQARFEIGIAHYKFKAAIDGKTSKFRAL